MKFTSRGYPQELVKKNWDKTEHTERGDLLADRGPRTDEKRVTFVSTFSHVSNRICAIIRKEWHILSDALKI